ncbi:MAG: cell division protein ZipA C-terminal FtsZ-binding domain-containing protein [Methylotenera sp.]|nr:cell division protein ZipA C-terminal FtsZ-binding domain-containing protein [Methylotenera sp.]
MQIVLIAIGALIIVTVLIINWWQEKRFHRQVESSFSPLKRDALLDDSFLDDSLLDGPPLDEPSLDVSKIYDTLDNRATNHFSIDNELSEIESPEIVMQAKSTPFRVDPSLIKTAEENIPVANIKSTDRFVKLPQSFELKNHDETLQEVSIDSAYEQLVTTQLDRQHASEIEVKLASNSSLDANASDHANVTQLHSFKEVFDEALKTTSQIETEGDNLSSVLEPMVSLPAMLHGQMDLTAMLYLAAETSVSTLNNALTGLFSGFDKPVFVHVLDANNLWHFLEELVSNPDAQQRQISRVACSMQLADRGGPVSRNTLNRFQLAVETFGLDINGHVEWQGTGDALTTAITLDAFCIEVDKTIGFHLAHGENGAFTGTKLRGLAEAQGLTLTADGAFKFFKDTATVPSFVIFNRDGNPFNPDMLRSSVVKGVTFQLDIPHVKQCTEAFTHMVQVARQMEIGLNAVLVDDNNKLLGDMQIEKIRQQLKVIQATMLVRGIVPGSDSAHRLFT